MKTPNALILIILILFGSRSLSANDSFDESIHPLLKEYCQTCHSRKEQAGELELERFSNETLVKQETDVWERALEQLKLGEMPPRDARQLSEEQKRKLSGWIQQMLDEVALANAGDPGPVVLRRLSNQEYTYTLRDLTEISSLDPAHEFPVDGAAGEGFTNAGAALVMSPGLLTKYLDAAKEVSHHMVLLPEGIRFSPSESPRDWSQESLAAIRDFYRQHSVPMEVINDVGGAGQLKAEGGSIPLERYLLALQQNGDRTGLSEKYLSLLKTALEGNQSSLLLDPLREKYRNRTLTPADIVSWQNVLWKFSPIGHIGTEQGPKSWQEPVNPLAEQQELSIELQEGADQTLYLVSGNAGAEKNEDRVLWENPRLVFKGRPDLPVSDFPGLLQHLESVRTQVLSETENCLAVLSGETVQANEEALALWRSYLGIGETKLEPLISNKLERSPDYEFIQGWTGANALSVLANSSDATVRIPGIMLPHSIATHPAPDMASVIAWKCPQAGEFTIRGDVVHAHPECGNGVIWVIEVRRGHAVETLASGESQRSQVIPFGPFENIPVEAGQVIALVIGPRDGDHSCDLTTVNLNISNGTESWDLARDISPNILAGNPHGAWHFLSQPAASAAPVDLPAPLVEWRRSPTPEKAAAVRKHLEQDFPLTHSLLAPAIRSFQSQGQPNRLEGTIPGSIKLTIPSAFTREARFVVTARPAAENHGGLQARIQASLPEQPMVTIDPGVPILITPENPARELYLKSFETFRNLFPRALCYTRIVPIDEVVTLRLYYREDGHLQRLMLSDADIETLNRLWEELLFVSEAPLKQVSAFEQIYQFATQDRPDLVNQFESLREPIHKAAADFVQQQQAADSQQRQAVIEYAALAWRRPLTANETAELSQYPPRLMLVRVLTSPDFLYRSEQSREQTGPVSDWELATRLSYFLWSSLPDEELRKLAAAGTLHNPAVLASQTRRMLRDEKIVRLANEFGCQWLHVRDVATLDEKSERHFPEFRDIRSDMQEEVSRFFVDLFQEDRNVLSLLNANHTFVNPPLAQLYGVQIDGTDWQRVDGIQEQGRGGILGFSATLAKHSGASRTSAILRGTWISEVILGDKLPKPPKGVPVLPDDTPPGLTERELIERHSGDPNCAGCHKRIDPYGFALEGFDAIGRTRDANTKTVLQDGTEIDGLAGLRQYLFDQRQDDFLKQFSRKLLGYALGRSVQLSDQPLLEQMVSREGHHVADLVELIVLSRQFREVRGIGISSQE